MERKSQYETNDFSMFDDTLNITTKKKSDSPTIFDPPSINTKRAKHVRGSINDRRANAIHSPNQQSFFHD